MGKLVGGEVLKTFYFRTEYVVIPAKKKKVFVAFYW